jgi:omega-amidase
MKCCTAQISSVWDDPGKTLEKARPLIQEAAQADADIICFPEQFATGWDPLSHSHIEDRSGKIIGTLRAYAREYSIAIIGSFRERIIPFPHNTTVAIGSDGTILATYAKMHLFTPAQENRAYTPGLDLGLFSLQGVRCGLAICYDLRFPSLFRIYAKKGVQAVFVPAAWPEQRIRHWEIFISARAAENQMYVLGCNTTGITPVDHYSGASMTADPQGSIISRAGDRETLLYTDIDPAVVERNRHDFPVETDRKDDLYQSLLEKHR